jgi:hypothetical protein
VAKIMNLICRNEKSIRKILSLNHGKDPSHSAFSLRTFLANHNIPLFSANQIRQMWKTARVLYSLADKYFKRISILDVSKDYPYCEAGTEHSSKEYE